MNGGPSMKILRGLESQPIWFHVGPNKSIIYRPFEVDNDALYVSALSFFVFDS